MRACVFFAGLTAAAVAMSAAVSASAQTSEFATDPLSQTSAGNPEETIGLRNGNFVAVPVPFSSPGVGAGLAVGVGYLFKLDPDARTSVVGVGALGTEKDSEAYAALANIAFGDNRWLLNVLVGDADLRYDLISDLGDLPLRQKGILGNFGLAYGVTPDLSFGGVLRYLDTEISLDFDSGLTLPPDLLPDAELELLNFSLTADWDLRDNTDYPTRGLRFYGEIMQGVALNADERRYEKLFANFDGYYPVAGRTVLAGRATACGSSDDTPFFDKCSIGITDNFRGYNATRFLDDRMVSFQAELRQRFTNRIGGVAFFGVGWAGEEFGALSDNGSNIAYGIGARYRVSRNFPVDFSVDISRNDLDDDIVYIYVGQRW